MNLFVLIVSDIRAKALWLYGSITWKTILKARFTDGSFAMILYRWMQWSRRRRLVPLAMLFNKLNVGIGTPPVRGCSGAYRIQSVVLGIQR